MGSFVDVVGEPMVQSAVRSIVDVVGAQPAVG